MGHESLQDLRQRIHMYFDNELCNDDCQSLLKKVETDARCSKMFNKEKNFREFIKTNVKRPSVSPDLIQNIKDRIRIV
jgi:hypothetical protein